MIDFKKKAEELIRELVLELQELEVGCSVHVFGGVFKIIETKTVGVDVKYIIKAHSCPCSDLLSKIEFDKILGSEIHAEHIAIACERRWKSSALNVFELSFYDGVITFKKRSKLGKWEERHSNNTEAIYDPLKPFHCQSKEFYEFIVKILE